MSTTTLIPMGAVASAVVSAAVCYVLVPRLVARHVAALIRSLDVQEDQMPTTSDQVKRRLPSTSTVIIIVLSAIIMLLAVQVRLSNVAKADADDDRDAVAEKTSDCLANYKSQTETWADGVTASLGERGDATGKLRSRDQSWHKRVDGIFQLLIGSRAGVEYTEDQIDEIADDYVRASERLFHAYDHAETATTDNPYPELTLSCKKAAS